MPREVSPRRVLVATLLGIFVTSFPVVILVAALPEIADGFGVGASSVGWVLTAPMIASAVLVPLFGRLGDLRGHRLVFLVGFTAAAVSAAMSAVSWNLGALIVLRTFSQAAGMATSPTALAMLMASHGPAERPKALGAWAFAGASAPVIGLLAGGPIVGAVGWRGLFVLEAVVIAVALPFCIRSLPATPTLPDVRFDVRGAVLLMLGSGAAVFALDRSAQWGFTSPGVVGPALVAPVALWAFLRVEHRTADPLLPPALLRRRGWVAPVAGDSLLQIPSIGAFFLAPLILDAVFERSVVESAYLLIPMPLGMSLLAPVGGWLTVRLGERRTAVLGALVMLVALGVGSVGVHTEALPLLVAGFALHGGAIGLSQPALASAAAGALDATTTGVGMAVMRMVAQLGSAAGISVAVASGAAHGFVFAYGVLAVVAVVAAVAAAGVTAGHRPEPIDLAMAGTLPALDV